MKVHTETQALEGHMLTERRGGLVCLVRRMILRAVRSEFVFPVSALAVLMTSVESRVNVLSWLLPCLMFSMSWQGDQPSLHLNL